MPNCDFYATPQDQLPLLDWLFAEGTCRVFENYSDFEKPLREFHSAHEVLAQFGRLHRNGAVWKAVHLQLYVNGACPPFVPRRFKLNPEACDGATFRYSASGLGFVQFYLEAPSEDGLRSCHTNHFSAAGAEQRGFPDPGMGPAENWDFKKITAFSARLNRQIKKMSVAKFGSRIVLPGALELWQAGTPLPPFMPSEDALVLL